MTKKRLQQLPRYQREASAIFAARTRTNDVKTNFKNEYKDTKFCMCNTEKETKKLVLEESRNIDRNENGKISENEIFT